MSNKKLDLFLRIGSFFYYGVLALALALGDVKKRPRPTAVRVQRAIGWTLFAMTYLIMTKTIFSPKPSYLQVALSVRVLYFVLVALVHTIAFIAGIKDHFEVLFCLLLGTFAIFIVTQIAYNPMHLGWSVAAHLAVAALLYALWQPLNVGEALGSNDDDHAHSENSRPVSEPIKKN